MRGYERILQKREAVLCMDNSYRGSCKRVNDSYHDSCKLLSDSGAMVTVIMV